MLYTTHRSPAAKGIRLIPKEVISALADMTSFLTMRLVDKAKNRGWKPSPLVPLKQIPRVHLVRHVRELVAPAVGDDHVAAGLEGLQVVGNLGAEELRRVQRRLVDHDALDGARAEVVGVGLLVVYAGVHLRAFDCSNLISRARFGQQRVLTESDIKRGVKGCRIGLKVHPLYIGTPLGAFVDHRRGRTRVILVQSTLREKG